MSNHFDRIDFIRRLRAIRSEVFGDDGIRALADLMGIPPGTWENYEAGVVVPDVIILRFVQLTRCNPHWLLTGKGTAYSPHIKPVIERGR